MRYGDDETLGEARARYFADNAFGADGGYPARWVKVDLGPLPIWFPNSDARRRAVRYHDLHHVLTDYDTDLLGEAEIGAWEIASGCAHHVAAWILNLLAFAWGFWLGRERVFRAFVRGRHSGNLYRETWDEALLTTRVGEQRERLGIAAMDAPARPGDTLAFAGSYALAVFVFVAWSALLLAPIVWLVRTLF